LTPDVQPPWVELAPLEPRLTICLVEPLRRTLSYEDGRLIGHSNMTASLVLEGLDRSMIEDGRARVVGCMVLDASMLLGVGVWLVWFVC